MFKKRIFMKCIKALFTIGFEKECLEMRMAINDSYTLRSLALIIMKQLFDLNRF